MTYTKWINGGSQHSGLTPMDDRIFKLVEGEGYPALGNLLYYENERSNIAIKFHFLTEEIGNKNNYRFFIEQYEKSGEFVGGEKFVIQREERQLFYADAGADESIDDGEATMLSASSIGEPATYKWYDENGILFHTGRDTSIAPSNTSTYKLEVTAHADGFKDYDEKTIEVRKQFIKSVQPNPSSDYITIQYKAENVNSAYIELANSLGDFSTKYPIDPQTNLLTIDVSGLITGTYFVKLNCNGIYRDVEIITIY